jgi:CHAT domain-containing protein
MPGRVVLLLLAFSLFASFQAEKPIPAASDLIKLYRKAEKLFSLSHPTDATDSLALYDFKLVIDRLEKNPNNGSDSILFQSYLKKGILMDVKNDFNGAKEAYLKALGLQHSDRLLSDSLAFRAYIYAGTSYFNLNNFDSANNLLLKAERLIDRFPTLSEKERLYMTMGALYYENGNYLQSKNNFNRALEIIEGKQPLDAIMRVSIETNLATSFYRLGLYPEAISIYKKILKQKVSTSFIYLNMGRTLAALHKYAGALEYYRKVFPAEIPGVYNEMALTQLQLSRPDSAEYFLDKFQSYKKNTKLNKLDIGINDLYRAELFVTEKRYSEALSRLQQSIVIFSGNFKSQDIHANPSDFVGTFTSYTLFEALFKKAAVLEQLYHSQPNEEYLHESLDAYNSALILLRYIEKCYDTDDSKIFLKKKSQEAYLGAFQVCMKLNHIHPEGDYLEQAFLIGEKNKASVISASLKEKALEKTPGMSEELLQKERNIKYNIARLNIKSDQAVDNQVIETIQREKSRNEIELYNVQKNLEQNNHYYKLKYEDSYPGIKELQQHIGGDQALISFYATKTDLHVFILTGSTFQHLQIDSLRLIHQDVEDWISLLKSTESGKKFNGEAVGSRLYTRLVKPILQLVSGKDNWIIIPDGILYFLPFESLPSGEDSKSLLETTEISYRFSSRFIVTEVNSKKSKDITNKVLAFAPFTGESEGINQLPSSLEEIAGLPGRQFIDSGATKEQFLKEINKFAVVHLATHAMSDINNSSASYIAFYPRKKSLPDDRLFLEEVYSLNLDATQLVIISACETGKGEIVNNEGVISLARAFAYAGCLSTINSLWKADDKATSAILRQFHLYLQKGYTKSKALQQAKIDYIKSDALNKSPNYWAHLILIGNTEPVYKKTGDISRALLVISFFCIFLMLTIGRKKLKKSRRFSRIQDFKMKNVI